VLENRFNIIKRLIYSITLIGVMQFSTLAVSHAAVKGAGDESLSNMVAKGNYSKALSAIQSLPEATQKRLDIRFYRATSLAGAGENSKAITAFEELIADEPKQPEFYNNLAMLLVEEGKLLKAQQMLEQGLRSKESYAMLYNNLTVVFETMARRSYAKALRVKRDQSPALSPLLSLEGFQPANTVVATVNDGNISVAEGEPLQNIETPEAVDNNVQEANQQIGLLLERWIDSWQRKDIDRYIDSYSPNFKSRSYSSHQAWMIGRNKRISRAGLIEISIKDIVVETLSLNRVQADFVMDYHSARYSDRSKKRVVFKRIGGEWRIVRELTLKVLNS